MTQRIEFDRQWSSCFDSLVISKIVAESFQCIDIWTRFLRHEAVSASHQATFSSLTFILPGKFDGDSESESSHLTWEPNLLLLTTAPLFWSSAVWWQPSPGDHCLKTFATMEISVKTNKLKQWASTKTRSSDGTPIILWIRVLSQYNNHKDKN